MATAYWFIFLLLCIAAFFSVKLGKLTIAAAVTGIFLSLLIFSGAGYTGVAMMAAFFILGSTATAFKITTKEALGLAEKNKGRRKAGQVLANAGVAAGAGLLIHLFPSQINILSTMMAASFAAATSDTLSSELGILYGRTCYNIITFKKDSRGANGVISAEGTFIGIAGSAIIGFIFSAGFSWNINLLYIIIAGTAGNIADSLLGATLERKNIIGNNTVNFLNTLAAAITAL
ncbi:MAG TPA: DUF92 domain-containing protein, partial [Panacibacter sp.]|nr:DUF92 domain-containing protein [Panacibacter sp.]